MSRTERKNPGSCDCRKKAVSISIQSFQRPNVCLHPSVLLSYHRCKELRPYKKAVAPSDCLQQQRDMLESKHRVVQQPVFGII